MFSVLLFLLYFMHVHYACVLSFFDLCIFPVELIFFLLSFISYVFLFRIFCTITRRYLLIFIRLVISPVSYFFLFFLSFFSCDYLFCFTTSASIKARSSLNSWPISKFYICPQLRLHMFVCKRNRCSLLQCSFCVALGYFKFCNLTF